MVDEYLARFQNLPPWNIHQLVDEGRATTPWYEVRTEDLVPELVVNEMDLASQVMSVTAQVQKWGRLEALAKRVWEVAERRYRSWRARLWLELEGQAGGKRLTETRFEQLYRTHEDYDLYQTAIERAEEAYTATHHVLEAWRVKKDMLQRFAVRYREDGAPRLAV